MAAGPSEFTRILGRVQPPAPNMPPAPVLPPGRQPPAPTPVIAPPPVAPAKRPTSYLPLIIALNVLLIGAIVAVVYFVIKK